MMWLPMLMRLQLESPGKRRVNLWLPLCLLWLLLFCLVLLLLPLLIIAGVCLFPRLRGRGLWRLVGQGYVVCCALRGLRVDVRDGAGTVKIYCL